MFDLSGVDQAWQINSLSLNYPALGWGLVVGSFSLLLTGLWLQIYRLRERVRRRDRRIASLLAVDAVTGLANRQSFCKSGQQLLERPSRTEIAVLVLNIDQFTTVNDCFGHPAGDSLLQQVGDRLQQHITQQDTLARTGDDEFAILLNPGHLTRVDAVVTKIMTALHEPFTIHSLRQTQQRVYVHSRVGIANASNHPKASAEYPAKSFSQLLSQASIAMAQAKRSGTSRQDWAARTVMFQPEMALKMRARSKRQRALRRAIERNELRVHYQPIVDLKTSLAVGFEALVRWQHPEEGLLSPDAFLPLAESMGLLVNIDRWVLQQVCQQLQSWQSRGMQPYVSVNLSGPHLDRPDLVDYVDCMLGRYAIAPNQLNMEITESVMIADPHQAMTTLGKLRTMGLRVSLDDFGTGYSSLGYLQQFPVDVLKIDRSFVQKLGQANGRSGKQDEFIVKSILSLAEGLNIRVVAEGIEYDDQFCQLKAMRCHYGQGHYFSKAVTSVAADDFLVQALGA